MQVWAQTRSPGVRPSFGVSYSSSPASPPSRQVLNVYDAKSEFRAPASARRSGGGKSDPR